MKLLRRFTIATILSLLIFSSLMADDLPTISIQAGVTLFPDPRGEDEVYVEFPFTVNRSQFEFVPKEDSSWYRASIFAEFILSDTFDVPIDTFGTFFYTRVNDSVEAHRKGIKLFNKLTALIPPGAYKGKLTVVDPVSKGFGSFLFNKLEIDPIEKKYLTLSNIELAYRIDMIEGEALQSQMRMVKNGRSILANPMGVFSGTDSSAYLYAELYNLEYDEAITDSFNISFVVYDDRGEIYYNFGNINLVKPGVSAVISNVLDIKDWEPGKYNLRVTAVDYADADTAESRRQFIIFPESGPLSTAISYQYKSPLDTAGPETLRQVLKYIVDQKDFTIFENLTEAGKHRFAKQFFADHDPTEGTDRNEYLENVLERYIYANNEFSSFPGANDGWRLDRGRVLMQYGNPSEIKEDISPSYSQPWQLWIYHQGRADNKKPLYFVFVDDDGYGEYKLVHSNADGEVYNQEWEFVLQGLGIE